MYRAAVRFADLQDNKHIYEVGDEFPRPGLEVSEERIKELAGKNNKCGYPLIIASEPKVRKRAKK